MKRFLAILMSVVLVVGLMPLPAFANLIQGSSTLVSSGDSGPIELTGLQLNEKPFTIANYGYSSDSAKYRVFPSYIETGEVVVDFEGAAAPWLALADANGKVLVSIVTESATKQTAFILNSENKEETVFTKEFPEDAPVLEWRSDSSVNGVERFSAETIVEALAAAGHELSEVRRVYLQGNTDKTIVDEATNEKVGTIVTIKRMLLTGMDPLPDVSNGNYGDKTVRRLYTRPVTLSTSPNSSPHLYRTTDIDIHNPIYEGADIAVRYTTPTDSQVFLQLCYVASGNDWKFTSLGEAEGARTALAHEETLEKVTFFSRDAIEACWQEAYGKDGAELEHIYVCVAYQTDSLPANSEQCDIVEVVALGGAERIKLSDEQKVKVTGKSAEEITRALNAGYNVCGHFESNYVPTPAAKDGGWGRSDLALEAQWSRGVYVTRETLHALKQQGFSAVRLPVTWFQHIYPTDDPTGDSATRTDLPPLERYHIDRAWMERVHEVVDWCIAEDLYVILNIHHEDWIDRQDLDTAYDETDLPVKFQAVWTQIANEFAGYDQRLIFEDMNEPHMWYYELNADGSIKLDSEGKKKTSWGYATEGSVNTVNRLNADFVKLMRTELAGHEERLLMLSHDTGSGEIAYTGWELPQDPANLLAASIHYYTPHDYTHYFANGNHKGETGEANVYTDSYRVEVEAAWENLRTRYTARGIPVVLGEFGVYYLGDNAQRQQERLDWMTQYATHAKELGVPMFYWRMDRTFKHDDGSEYVAWSAFDETTHEMSPLSAHMFEKWFQILGDDSIEWGAYASIEEGELGDIDSGIQLFKALSEKDVKEIHGNHLGNTTDWYAAFSGGFSWDDIEGKQIAVKYAGNTPRLGVTKGYKGDYWGIDPDIVDYQNGIAYFKASSIAIRWAKVIAENDAKPIDKQTPELVAATVQHINRICVVTATSGMKTPLDEVISTSILQVAIVHQHDWGAWIEVGEDNGEAVETRICNSDNNHNMHRVVHKWGAWHTDIIATCEGDGLKARVCPNHPEEVQAQVMPALGHDWESTYIVDLEPTCAAPGSKSIHCARCNEVKDTVSIPALGHSWDAGVVTAKPMCTADGVKTFSCERCKETCTEAIAKLGHDWGSKRAADVAPTCTTKGSESYHCARCSEKKDAVALVALRHEWGAWTKLDASQHQRVCAHDSAHVENAAHTWDAGKVTKAATTAAAGVRTFTCTGCGATKTAAIAKLPKSASSITLKDQTLTYTGKQLAYTLKPVVKGSTGKVTFAYFSDAKCTKAVKAANVKNAGIYYVKATVAAKGNYAAATSKAAKLTVKKASQKVSARNVSKSFASSKKTKALPASKIVNVKALSKASAKTSLSFAKANKAGGAKIVIAAKTGKLTAKKGLKRNKYKVKVKVSAKGTANYKAAKKFVYVTLAVR